MQDEKTEIDCIRKVEKKFPSSKGNFSLHKAHAFVQYYEGNHISKRNTRSCHSGLLWLARYDLYIRETRTFGRM